MRVEQDDAKRLRVLDAGLVDRSSQGGRDPSLGMPSIVAQTKQISSYPNSARQFFGCSPVTILGPEVEGGIGASTPGASTFLALNLGSAVPPSGSNVIATFVENRWVFRYDG